MKNYLIVVEGADLELNFFKNIFENVLKDFKVDTKIYNPQNQEELLIFDKEDDKTIYIIKPKHNRLSEIVEDIKKSNTDIDAFKTYLNYEVEPDFFDKIFLIYDIDETCEDSLKMASSYFCDECSNGLLLVSSPCFDSIIDFRDCSFSLTDGEHISKTYKKDIKQYFLETFPSYCDIKYSDFVKRNPFSLMEINFLKNEKEFNGAFFMDHPKIFFENYFPEYKDGNINFSYLINCVYVVFGSIYDFDFSSKPNVELHNFLTNNICFDNCRDYIFCQLEEYIKLIS